MALDTVDTRAQAHAIELALEGFFGADDAPPVADGLGVDVGRGTEALAQGIKLNNHGQGRVRTKLCLGLAVKLLEQLVLNGLDVIGGRKFFQVLEDIMGKDTKSHRVEFASVVGFRLHV